jgi:hypothetical protein
MDSVLKNAKAGAIILARNPGLTLLGVLSMALAIGANTSIFNTVNAMTLVPNCTEGRDTFVTVLTNRQAPAFDSCGDFEMVETQLESNGEGVGFESVTTAPVTPENEPHLVAGNQGAAQSHPGLPRNQAAGSRCGQSRSGKTDLAAACDGYVLQLQ